MIYTIQTKITLCKLNDEEILDDDGMTTYPFESNIPIIKNFDDNIIPNSIEELGQIYTEFIKKMINMSQEKEQNNII